MTDDVERGACAAPPATTAASEIPEPAWAKGVDNWAPLSARQLARVARTRKLGQPLRAGWSYHSVACEGGPYLSWLHQRVQRAGGRVLRAPRPVGALGALLDRQEHATWRHAPPDPPPAPFVPPQPSSQSGACVQSGSVAFLPTGFEPRGGDALTMRVGHAGGAGAPGGGIQGLTLEQFLQRDGAHAPLPPTPVPGTSPPASLEGLAPFEGLGGRAPALVVNCSGLGAGRLLNDKEVAPIRGACLSRGSSGQCRALLVGTTDVRSGQGRDCDASPFTRRRPDGARVGAVGHVGVPHPLRPLRHPQQLHHCAGWHWPGAAHA